MSKNGPVYQISWSLPILQDGSYIFEFQTWLYGKSENKKLYMFCLLDIILFTRPNTTVSPKKSCRGGAGQGGG